MTSFRIVHLDDGPPDGDVVVVIDVLRAFATAGAAFAAGARRILCVESLAHGLRLRDEFPGALLVGEDKGVRAQGYDADNSPVEVAALDLSGRTVVQRTTNGTRGLAAAVSARALLALGATNVGATAAWIRGLHPSAAVTAVTTGSHTEDDACARHLGELLLGRTPDPERLGATVVRVGREIAGDWNARGLTKHAGWAADVQAASAVDRFGFAIVGASRTGAPGVVELHAETP